MTKFIYVVYCGDDAQQFETEVEAMEYARTKNSARVEKAEVEENGEFLNSEVIWEGTNIMQPEENKQIEKDNPFETEFPKSDIEDIAGSDDPDYEYIKAEYEKSQEDQKD